MKCYVSTGADTIWAGHAAPWRSVAGCDRLSELPGVIPVPLDITQDGSIERLAAEMGPRVEVFVNNLATIVAEGPASAESVMYRHYFGLRQLVRHFETPMSQHRTQGASMLAWVNVLSIFALGSAGVHTAFAAAMAAARSESMELRARLRSAGIRVLNVFPGPLEGGSAGAPTVSASAVSRAIVAALGDGVEDVFPGDFAQDWLQRWRANPLAFERELAVVR